LCAIRAATYASVLTLKNSHLLAGSQVSAYAGIWLSGNSCQVD